ncbi:unnamed protein product [Zymoseptoria tritici ST99CH_3D1]|uniref:Uncharacterized protein n=1 Tax=Zymoseptoria tritici ST99CH_1E4 TaxID=1276532 RepID=A0A2H1H9Y9_ZYMTR|nr:unnamed protein product [Zymoseptoria tritici ST99CH_1E4]SMR65104.1 unnamed protein product [Zymoseptoria tritici ST99CH_3D1]
MQLLFTTVISAGFQIQLSNNLDNINLSNDSGSNLNLSNLSNSDLSRELFRTTLLPALTSPISPSTPSSPPAPTLPSPSHSSQKPPFAKPTLSRWPAG